MILQNGRRAQPRRLRLPARGTTWRVLAERHKSISLHQRKEEERGLFLFCHFWGKLSYMSGKIVLYDRENYKQARKNLLLDNFHDVLLSKNFLDFRRIFLGADFPFLNYL